jgi:uncharacterized iron-regulated membrane protein
MLFYNKNLVERPTEADSMAIDIRNNKVIDHLLLKDFPIAAKLTGWAVDAHIGVLFCWINQLILRIYSIALCFMILFALWLWSRTFNLKQTTSNFVKQSLQLWKIGNIKQRLFSSVAAHFSTLFTNISNQQA